MATPQEMSTAADIYTIQAIVLAIGILTGIATAFTPLAQRIAAQVAQVIGEESSRLSLAAHKWLVGMLTCGLAGMAPLGTWA
jgi:hypothetical protein